MQDLLFLSHLITKAWGVICLHIIISTNFKDILKLIFFIKTCNLVNNTKFGTELQRFFKYK